MGFVPLLDRMRARWAALPAAERHAIEDQSSAHERSADLAKDIAKAGISVPTPPASCEHTRPSTRRVH